MNILFQLLFALIPVVLLLVATAVSASKVSAGRLSVKKSLGMNAAVFVTLMLVGGLDELHLDLFQLLIELIKGRSFRIFDDLHNVSLDLFAS